MLKITIGGINILKTLIILTVLLLIVYIKNLFKIKLKTKRLKWLVALYEDLLNEFAKPEAKFRPYGEPPTVKEGELFAKIINSVPLIKSVVSNPYFEIPRLRDIHDIQLFQSNYQHLHEELVQELYDFKRYLNPFKSVEDVLLLPLSILEFLFPVVFDFKIKKTLSSLVWILGFLINLYSNEIKFFINSFF